jgi:threonine dehydrogenase-like Zn-dependent dehydrogenase
MKALCWHGKSDIRCETVPDPKIEAPRDAIIRVTACAICGSDLHIFNGVIPEMKRGDIIGHETMGEVVEVGSENKKLKVGDRVVVPFTIACGECFFCQMVFILVVSGQILTRRRPKKCGAIPLLGFSAIRTFSEASPGVRPNI